MGDPFDYDAQASASMGMSDDVPNVSSGGGGMGMGMAMGGGGGQEFQPLTYDTPYGGYPMQQDNSRGGRGPTIGMTMNQFGRLGGGKPYKGYQRGGQTWGREQFGWGGKQARAKKGFGAATYDQKSYNSQPAIDYRHPDNAGKDKEEKLAVEATTRLDFEPEITKVIDMIMQPAEFYEQANDLLTEMEGYITTIFEKEGFVEVRPHGSFTQRTTMKGDPVDVALIMHDIQVMNNDPLDTSRPVKNKKVSLLRDLSLQLVVKNKETVIKETIWFARLPVLKLKYKNQLDCDIMCGKIQTGVSDARVHEMMEQDPLVKRVFILVKYWASMRFNIPDKTWKFYGLPCELCWACLFLYFCIENRYIHCYKDMNETNRDKFKRVGIDDLDLDPMPLIKFGGSEVDLFMDFLQFVGIMSIDPDITDWKYSIIHGERVRKTIEDGEAQILWLEDPGDPEYNAARHLRIVGWGIVIDEARDTLDLIQNDAYNRVFSRRVHSAAVLEGLYQGGNPALTARAALLAEQMPQKKSKGFGDKGKKGKFGKDRGPYGGKGGGGGYGKSYGGGGGYNKGKGPMGDGMTRMSRPSVEETMTNAVNSGLKPFDMKQFEITGDDE